MRRAFRTKLPTPLRRMNSNSVWRRLDMFTSCSWLMKSNQGRQILQDIFTYGDYGKLHNYSESDEEIESCDDSAGSESGSDNSDCVVYGDNSSGSHSNSFNLTQVFIF